METDGICVILFPSMEAGLEKGADSFQLAEKLDYKNTGMIEWHGGRGHGLSPWASLLHTHRVPKYCTLE